MPCTLCHVVLRLNDWCRDEISESNVECICRRERRQPIMSVGTLDSQALRRAANRLVTRRQQRTEGGVAPGEKPFYLNRVERRLYRAGRDASMEIREPKLFIAAGILLTAAGFLLMPLGAVLQRDDRGDSTCEWGRYVASFGGLITSAAVIRPPLS